MKIYIAGKITGNKEYKEQFALAKMRLEDKGHIVLNPAELPEGMKPSDYMRICIAMIDCADAVVLIGDWDRSAGANVEYNYAKYVGKEAYQQYDIGFYSMTNSRWLSD